jgi:GNAT superfamily N-acetyltransferase
MQLFIREVLAEDAADITRLSNQLGYAISVPATLQNLETIRKNQNEAIFIAAYEKEVIGSIHVFYTTRLESGSFCEIGGMVVNDQYRRMGIGKMLIERIKLWCVKKATNKLRVRCNIKRTDAHDFYFGLGFRENKQQKVLEINLDH